MDKAQNSTCAIVFILFADFPPALVGIKISYFVNYFFYIFLSTRITRDGSTKNFTLNRGEMWPTQNQERFLIIWKQLRTLKTQCLWIFFEFRHLSAVKNWAKTEHRAKSYACFTEGNSSYGFERHNLADKTAAARAKLPWTPAHETAEQSISARAKYPWYMQ